MTTTRESQDFVGSKELQRAQREKCRVQDCGIFRRHLGRGVEGGLNSEVKGIRRESGMGVREMGWREVETEGG